MAGGTGFDSQLQHSGFHVAILERLQARWHRRMPLRFQTLGMGTKKVVSPPIEGGDAGSNPAV